MSPEDRSPGDVPPGGEAAGDGPLGWPEPREGESLAGGGGIGWPGDLR